MSQHSSASTSPTAAEDAAPSEDSTPLVLAVVPAHNEAGRVGRVVEGLVAQGLPVLVVDDGSTDETADEARAAGAVVISLSPNQGKGEALKAGFRTALAGTDPAARKPSSDAAPEPSSAVTPEPSSDARSAFLSRSWAAFLTLDADGQHDPAEVPRLLEAWRKTGADLVVGFRDYREMPPVRRFTNTVSRLVFSWALGRWIPDNQSGFRLRSRRLAEAALASPERGFAFEVEEIAICAGRAYRLAWVPVKTIYGSERSDIRPWSHLVSFLRVTWRARRRMRAERCAIGRGPGWDCPEGPA